MSDIIQLLPDHVANQIAAGEVVQRPASIVKELMENAIDAGASSVQLHVEQAGKASLLLTDNGKGMSTTDARLSFERHATSKISKTEDIFQILTKGFRGEALASIAAVAQVEMNTKKKDDEVGTLIKIEGGKLISQEVITCNDGTHISVKNLFFNVPARRTFLKSDNVEFRHILDEYHRVVLAHEDVEFRLYHNKKMVYHNRSGGRLQRILQIFGAKQENFLTPVEEQTHHLVIQGFVGKPDISRKTKGMQFFFINNRFIKSPFLHRAVSQAYDDLLPPKHHPAYFLFLKIDPLKIDINIHPTKTEVKFEDENLIYGILNAAVKRSLGKFQVKDTLDFDEPSSFQMPLPKSIDRIKAPEIRVDRSFNPFQNSKDSSATKPFEIKKTALLYEDQMDWVEENSTEALPLEMEENQKDVMQWRSSFLVTERDGELWFFDQHRIHQTVLYQKFFNQIVKNTISQQLLFPIEIPLNREETLRIKTLTDELFAIGFDFSFVDELMQINAIPGELNSEAAVLIVRDLIEIQENFDPSLSHNEQLARSMAKTCAVKKGEPLQQNQKKLLIEDFFRLDAPQYSPFGKKNYSVKTYDDLKKDF